MLYKPFKEGDTVTVFNFSKYFVMGSLLSERDKEIAEEYSKKRASSRKKSKYGKGVLNSEKDPFFVERLGILGEIGFARLFDLGVDLTYRRGGDLFDFKVNGVKIDVKTSYLELRESRISANHFNSKKWFLVARTDRGGFIQLTCDLYGCGVLFKSGDKTLYTLAGFINRSKIQSKPFVKSPRGSHFNYEIEMQDLEFKEEWINLFAK